MKKLILILWAIISFEWTAAQEGPGKETGVRIGYGIKNEHINDNEIYKPIVVMPYYNHFLTKPDHRARMSAYLEELFGTVIIDRKDTRKSTTEWEVGAHAGPSFSYRFNWFTPYIAAGFGFNYITMSSGKQKGGVICEESVFSGIKRNLGSTLVADGYFRIRHMSNGGTKLPNHGIDTWMVGLGISKMY